MKIPPIYMSFLTKRETKKYLFVANLPKLHTWSFSTTPFYINALFLLLCSCGDWFGLGRFYGID